MYVVGANSFNYFICKQSTLIHGIIPLLYVTSCYKRKKIIWKRETTKVIKEKLQ